MCYVFYVLFLKLLRAARGGRNVVPSVGSSRGTSVLNVWGP